MKKTKLLSIAVLACAVCAGFTSCSDDDKDEPVIPEVNGDKVPKPEDVFENGIPDKVGPMTVVKNDKGQITSLSGGGKTVTFEYGANTTVGGRAANTGYDVLMTVTSDYDRDVDRYYLQLNDKGYISHAYEIDEDGDFEKWWFEYNAAGQLNSMKTREDGRDEVTRVTYVDGDISKVSKPHDRSYNVISYTSETVTTPIVNKGCLMLFDDTFELDMDDLDYAYYAGLLGTATKHLPVKSVEEDGEYETFDWTLDANGFPTRLIIREWRPGGTSSSFEDVMNFVW